MRSQILLAKIFFFQELCLRSRIEPGLLQGYEFRILQRQDDLVFTHIITWKERNTMYSPTHTKGNRCVLLWRYHQDAVKRRCIGHLSSSRSTVHLQAVGRFLKTVLLYRLYRCRFIGCFFSGTTSARGHHQRVA